MGCRFCTLFLETKRLPLEVLKRGWSAGDSENWYLEYETQQIQQDEDIIASKKHIDRDI